MSISRLVCAAFGLIALSIAGCTDDPVFPAQGLVVTASDMPTIGGPATYELWLSYPPESTIGKDIDIDHNEPDYFSVGKFTVDASGALRSADGSAAATFAIPSGFNPTLVGEALVTVEPVGDTDGKPDAPFLAGDVTGDADHGHATLLAGSKRTFDSTALQQVQGSFVLEAPTSSRSDDQFSGIWFVSHRTNPVNGDSISPSMTLRTLPLHHDNDKWTYEAWLVDRSGAVETYQSLGRFRNPASADSTGAGPGAGPNVLAAYGYPGEDFVTTSLLLNKPTYDVVVSLQPESIPLTAPLLRVLQRTGIGENVNSGEDIQMVLSQKRPTVGISFDK